MSRLQRREILRKLRRAASQHAPNVTSIMLRAFDDARNEIDLKALEASLTIGDTNGIDREVDKIVASFTGATVRSMRAAQAKETLAAELLNTMQDAGNAVRCDVPRKRPFKGGKPERLR